MSFFTYQKDSLADSDLTRATYVIRKLSNFTKSINNTERFQYVHSILKGVTLMGVSERLMNPEGTL